MRHLTLIIRNITTTEVYRASGIKPFAATGSNMLFTFVKTKKETKIRTHSNENSFTEEGFSLN